MTNEPLTVLIVDDEFACYLDQPDPGSGKSPAVQWLETVFTGRWALGTYHNDNLVPGPRHMRPMIEFLDQPGDDNDDDADGPMMIFPSDYDAPGRWWL